MTDDMPRAEKPESGAGRIDFGSDAHEVPPGDAAFDAWMRGIAPAINAPTPAPRRDMWSAIQAAQLTSREAQAGRIAGLTPLRRHWRLLSAIAAALVLGVLIDRLALRDAATSAVATNPVPPDPPADPADPSRLYQLAATQTLTQAEALLTAYRAGGVATRDTAATRQLATWGRHVLGSTRLLIDSPAGTEPRLRSLLSDLELVLVQIIQVSGAPLDPGERALIERALQERDLLPRIRSVVPAGDVAVSGATSD